jgi:hypothetical protein
VRVKPSLCCLYIALLALTAGCERIPTPSTDNTFEATTAANIAWPQFVEDFIEGYFVANPTKALGAGRHEFDGQLPDWSAEGFEREIQRLTQLRQRAETFTDATLLPEHRFQRDYLISKIDTDLFWLRDARQPFTNPAYYFSNGLDPSIYIAVPYAPPEQRMQAFIAYLRAVPNALQQIQTNLDAPLPRPFIDYAARGFGGFAEFYRKDATAAFASVEDAQLQHDLAEAVKAASAAMERARRWVLSRPVAREGSFALGAERFAAMLRMTEGVSTPLDRLEAIGAADLERNLAALASACSQLAPDASIKSCLSKVSADKPKEGSVAAAREQLVALRQFVADRNIVSIPGAEDALVAEAPPYRRQNLAYIHIPGPYDAGMPSVYYIAPPDPAWTRAEQAAYLPSRAELLFVTIHEVWPGHFLHFLHAKRAQWRFGQLFSSYAFAEGWGHYAEELMVEQGIADDAPALRVGQALNALLRNVRYMCAIGLHTKGMTVAECERMFKEKAFQDAGNARQQAARGTYDPAYLNYTLGKLILLKLRADWLRDRSDEAALREFHDELLSHGSPPLPLLRAQLLRNDGGELF